MPHHGPRLAALSSAARAPTRRVVLAGIAAGAAGAALKAPPALALASDLPATIAEAGKRRRHP